MERLILPDDINGVSTSQPIDSQGWLTVAKAVFGPVGKPETSNFAKTKIILPDGSNRELAVGSGSKSIKGKLRFGDSTDESEYGIWIPTQGVEPQPLLTQPERWFDEGYDGILFRTTAGVLRAGAQSIGVLQGRKAEAREGAKDLTTHLFEKVADSFEDLEEEELEEAEDDRRSKGHELIKKVLGPSATKHFSVYSAYVGEVSSRLSEVALLNGL